jgi:hypothetical protein
MNQIRRHATRCLWLDGGRVRGDGDPIIVVADYESSFASRGTYEAPSAGPQTPARFSEWALIPEASTRAVDRRNVLSTSGPFAVTFTLHVTRPLTNAVHGAALLRDGTRLWGMDFRLQDLQPGVYTLAHRFPGLPLQPGAYSWKVSIAEGNTLIDVWDCVPELVIAVPPVTHHLDQFSGVLNIAPLLDVDRQPRPNAAA